MVTEDMSKATFRPHSDPGGRRFTFTAAQIRNALDLEVGALAATDAPHGGEPVLAAMDEFGIVGAGAQLQTP